MITNVNSLAQARPVKVGTPCTICFWSDCKPAEIIEVRRDGKELVVRDMNYKVISGSTQDGSAEYEYSSCENASTSVWTLRKNGKYYAKGASIKDSNSLGIGYARRYYDPHF